MALTRLELGDLYFSKGGALERKFLGSVLWMSLQIRLGYYADPNANQTNWANHVFGCDASEKGRIAREAMEWGLCENTDLQSQGDSLADGSIDWIVAEQAKTWVAPQA